MGYACVYVGVIVCGGEGKLSLFFFCVLVPQNNNNKNSCRHEKGMNNITRIGVE